MEVKDFADKSEKLFRAVLEPSKKPKLWRSNGKVSNAVFETRKHLDEKGISVDRALGRNDKEAIDFTQSHLSGWVVSLTVEDCDNNSVIIMHTPSKDNIFHSEIRYPESDSEIEIKRKQLVLANLAKLEKYSIK